MNELEVWQDAESGCWKARTPEGTFNLYLHNGGLVVNGTGPRDARKHHLAITMAPRSGNTVVIHYERRDLDA